jgi:hypothetical protein
MMRPAWVRICLLCVLSGITASHAPAAAGAAAQPADLASVCRQVWGLRADGTNLRDFPASIPAPPAEARRCAAREGSRTVYYVWNSTFEQTLSYWETALMRQGFRTQRVGGKTPARGFLRFSGPQQGKISLSPRGGGFVIVLGPS